MHRNSFRTITASSSLAISSIVVVLASLVMFVAFAFAGLSHSFKDNPANGTSLRSGLTQNDQTETLPQAPDPQVKAVLDQMAAAGVLHPRTLDQARAAYLFYTKFAGTPENVLRVENRQIPGSAGEIPIRLYAARLGGGLPIWVFFHGGGFVTGSLDTHDTPLRAIANRCDCLIVSVTYRLAPESRYPAAPNDAYAATKWIADHANEIGGDPTRIAVGGDGAGGNLAAVVTMMARDHVDLLSIDAKVPDRIDLRRAATGGLHLISQVLIYPTLDLSLLTRSWILSHDPVFTTDSMPLMTSAYLPANVDPQEPYISPAHAQNLQDLPPAFIVTDQDDPVWDEAQGYARDLKSAGVPVEVSSYTNVIHGFFLMAGQLDAGKKAIDEIAAFLRQAFASGKPS